MRKIAIQVDGKPDVISVEDEIPIVDAPLTNEDIQQLRQQAYKDESDSLYMAYMKYEEQGRTDEAQTARTKWLEKIDEINLRYPYNNDES